LLPCTHMPHPRLGHGGHPHLLLPHHHVSDHPRPLDHGAWLRTDAHRPHSRCQHHCRRQLLRHVREPRPILWACVGQRSVDQPLGLLGWPNGRCPLAGFVYETLFVVKKS
ncbi:hypothetical protein CFC21_069001, partial [Triticum aestivum]